MFTGIGYVHLIAVLCACRLIAASGANDEPTVTIVATSVPAAAAAPVSSDDWQPRMMVHNTHPLGGNHLTTNDMLNERPIHSDPAYYNSGVNYNFSRDASEHGLGHYVSSHQPSSNPSNQSYLAHISEAYRQSAASPNHIMSRINVQPLRNEVTTATPAIFNTQYMNTFREIRSTVVTIFQRVQEFVSYMVNFFTTGKCYTVAVR